MSSPLPALTSSASVSFDGGSVSSSASPSALAPPPRCSPTCRTTHEFPRQASIMIRILAEPDRITPGHGRGLRDPAASGAPLSSSASPSAPAPYSSPTLSHPSTTYKFPTKEASRSSIHAGTVVAKLAAGLEASLRPFIWVIKETVGLNAEFEARVKDWGMVIRGPAPPYLNFNPSSTTGWNSTVEAVSHGLPLLTWPHFADQFLNKALVVDVLGIGVRVGVKVPATHIWLVKPGELLEVQVGRDLVERAVAEVMDEGPAGAARRARANELGEKVRAVMAEGGSPDTNVKDMIRHIIELPRKEEGKLPVASE
ncbi:UDP-glycosyltransferase 73C3-like [Panicum miliaceum]|uniref:UDP-glycosyltransferase 73C3-like n=1 Tax=Panicum miliaceum TaxID=4540 RepID=A0A3L6TT07_PANMI|nr:UDP-glycosyltransferase 73C3-like [Panicum miliaceum]